jgi:hypothetical protein
MSLLKAQRDAAWHISRLTACFGIWNRRAGHPTGSWISGEVERAKCEKMNIENEASGGQRQPSGNPQVGRVPPHPIAPTQKRTQEVL